MMQSNNNKYETYITIKQKKHHCNSKIFVSLFICSIIYVPFVYSKDQQEYNASNVVTPTNKLIETQNQITFDGFGHISINVEDIEKATKYYEDLFVAKKIQEFPHFKNIGFAKAAGFLAFPEKVDVSIRFLEIPGANVFLELFCYHYPKGSQDIKYFNTNDIGGVRHICLRVKNIDQAFNLVRNNGVKLINPSPDYRAFKIDPITTKEFRFFDSKLENDMSQKQKVCDIVRQVKYFYFIDQYGVQWELEEGHTEVVGRNH